MVEGSGYDIGRTEMFCDMCMIVLDVAELNVANLDKSYELACELRVESGSCQQHMILT